jgi:2-oxoglutarate ferredoxin oxidoreductase subunit alpha
MQGDVACAEGALFAGCSFYAGYPITPSTEIMEHLSVRLPQEGGIFIQMEDEIASISAVIGASWAGKKAMIATSGPGLSLMQENIGFSVMTETPLVIVNVMRGSPSTGQPTKASQSDILAVSAGSHGDYEIIALSPASVQEMFDFTVKAFNLAELYRTPTFVVCDEIVGHMREKILIPKPGDIFLVKRKRPEKKRLVYVYNNDDMVSPMPCFGEGYRVYITGLTHDKYGFPSSNPSVHHNLVKRLRNKILKNIDKIIEYEEIYLDDAEIAVIAYGIESRSALKAVRDARKLGIKVGMLRLKTIWPFPKKLINKVIEKVNIILVFEMNFGQIGRYIELFGHERAKVEYFSKLGGLPHTPSEILRKIKKYRRKYGTSS